MFKQDQQGLTLIETMMAVAVIGIASALAAPLYRSHSIDSQVEDGLRLGEHWKRAVAEYYVANGEWPSQPAIDGMAPAADKYASVSVAGGVIQITYGGGAVQAQLNGAMLTLVPYIGRDNEVIWQCGRAPAPRGIIARGASAATTTLAPPQLPAGCAG